MQGRVLIRAAIERFRQRAVNSVISEAALGKESIWNQWFAQARPLHTVGAMIARATLLTFALFLSACGGSPTNPTESGGAFQGAIVSALDGQPLSQVTVKIGSQTAVSDASGSFQVANVASGSQTAVSYTHLTLPTILRV